MFIHKINVTAIDKHNGVAVFDMYVSDHTTDGSQVYSYSEMVEHFEDDFGDEYSDHDFTIHRSTVA